MYELTTEMLPLLAGSVVELREVRTDWRRKIHACGGVLAAITSITHKCLVQWDMLVFFTQHLGSAEGEFVW